MNSEWSIYSYKCLPQLLPPHHHPSSLLLPPHPPGYFAIEDLNSASTCRKLFAIIHEQCVDNFAETTHFFRIEATLESSCPAQQCCKLSRLPKSFHSGPVIPFTSIHWCKSTGTFSECQKRNWEINKHLQVDCSPILYKVFPSVLQIFMCKQGVRFWFAAVAQRISCAVQSMCKLCRKTEFYDSEAGPTVRCYLRMATNFSAKSLTREPSPQSATQAAGISSSVPMEPKHAPAMDARLAVQPPTLMLASTAST